MAIAEKPHGGSECDVLPIAGLLALAMTGFIAILTETLPAGLLPGMAEGLRVSEALAGQTVTAYATGSLIAAIPLTVLTQGWRRRPTLLAAITGLLVGNVVTALSSAFWMTLVARFAAGAAGGLAWGLLSGYARRMVVGRLEGRALAIALVGTPVALCIGAPAGALIGASVGWRMAFLAMSGITIALIVWVLWKVPDFEGQPPRQRLSVRKVMTIPGIRPVLATIFAWMMAHNMLYTYVSPLAALSGLQRQIDLLLLVFGLAALIGIAMTALLVDRILRTLVLIGISAFAGVALTLGMAAAMPAIVFACVILWGLSSGGAGTQLQTASADAAGNSVDLANAIVTTVWNSAIAMGGIVGGLLLDHVGARSIPWAAFALALAALGIAFFGRRYGFVPGPRAHV